MPTTQVLMPQLGESVDEGEGNLDAAIRNGGKGTAMGLSEGALVLNAVKARLANDPTAPPPDQLSFATFGDPIAKHPFGESFLTQNFPVGSVVPFMDYRIPAPVESQYHTDQYISAYDSIADWPDRPDNWMSVINAIAGLATGHTAIAFTDRQRRCQCQLARSRRRYRRCTARHLLCRRHRGLRDR